MEKRGFFPQYFSCFLCQAKEQGGYSRGSHLPQSEEGGRELIAHEASGVGVHVLPVIVLPLCKSPKKALSELPENHKLGGNTCGGVLEPPKPGNRSGAELSPPPVLRCPSLVTQRWNVERWSFGWSNFLSSGFLFLIHWRIYTEIQKISIPHIRTAE